MTEAKTQKYQILSRVKIGSEYFAPEDGEALFMDLESKSHHFYSKRSQKHHQELAQSHQNISIISGRCPCKS